MNQKLFGMLFVSVGVLGQAALVARAEQPEERLQEDRTLLDDRRAESGFKSIFNGKDLTGWDGNPKLDRKSTRLNSSH